MSHPATASPATAAELTATLCHTVRDRASGPVPFAIEDHLDKVLRGVGIAADSVGGAITFEGRDPIVPSVFRIASAAGIGLVAKSVAMAALWRERTGQGQDIALDLRRAPHRLCPFYDRKWELLNGYPPRNTADPDSPFTLTFYETQDSRWVMPLNLYPRLRSSALRLLGCSDDPRPWPRPSAAGRPPSWSRRAPPPAS